jgi:hypothetical protein
MESEDRVDKRDTIKEGLAHYDGAIGEVVAFQVEQLGALRLTPTVIDFGDQEELAENARLPARLSRLPSHAGVKIGFDPEKGALYYIKGEASLLMRFASLDPDSNCAVFIVEKDKELGKVLTVTFDETHLWLQKLLTRDRVGSFMWLELTEFDDTDQEIIKANVIDITKSD